jgi:N-acetylglucosaminyl-diphospho-decaprenol L-rhamnosyltransferase
MVPTHGYRTPAKVRRFMKHASVSVISVTYNSSGIIAGMLNSLPAHADVILVDNNSGDAEATAAIARSRAARFLRMEHNVGFGAACNAAARTTHSDWLLFLNPDVTLQADALDEMLLATQRHPRASALGPLIRSPGNLSAIKRSSVLLPRKDWIGSSGPLQQGPVPVLSGAALLVRRAAFEAVGGFDEAIFLYHEDDDLCLRLAKEWGPLIMVPTAVVTHAGGGSSGASLEVAALKGWHMGRSRIHAARKHGRQLPFASALMLALFQLASPAVAYSSRKRVKQFGFLRGVWSMRRTASGAGGRDERTS